MAVHASGEGDAVVTGPAVVSGCMAFLAGRAQMRSSQLEARFGVIEMLLVDFGALPASSRVALLAVGAKPAPVLVLVARSALRRNAKPCAAQVLGPQQGVRLRCNVPRLMTAPATDPGVLPIQCVSRFGVVKALRRRIPVQQVELLTIVIGVALHARRAFRPFLGKGRVQPPLLMQFAGNFAMALKAAELRRPRGNLMALHAVCRAVQVLVRAGKWPRRDLCARWKAGKKHQSYSNSTACAPRPSSAAVLLFAWPVQPLRQWGIFNDSLPVRHLAVPYPLSVANQAASSERKPVMEPPDALLSNMNESLQPRGNTENCMRRLYHIMSASRLLTSCAPFGASR